MALALTLADLFRLQWSRVDAMGDEAHDLALAILRAKEKLAAIHAALEATYRMVASMPTERGGVDW